MTTHHIHLTREAHESCLQKPTTRLLHTILALKPGDTLIITADQTLIPKERLFQTLETTGLEVRDVREDYNLITITAVKK